MSGEGWRLGYSPDAEVFVGLVGAENWAIELTEQELTDFYRLSLQLIETMAAMQAELADEEKLTCSAQTTNISIEASGFADSFTIHLQLLNGRRGEGIWTSRAIAEILRTLVQIYP
ncbi:protein of unknown function (DUF1818) [Synechococcus sp. PCC 7502]|nr:protein of unknown function (DUF1818) [Synechococcus sp. PCC 7502]